MDKIAIGRRMASGILSLDRIRTIAKPKAAIMKIIVASDSNEWKPPSRRWT
jgi:hypothetical protein